MNLVIEKKKKNVNIHMYSSKRSNYTGCLFVHFAARLLNTEQNRKEIDATITYAYLCPLNLRGGGGERGVYCFWCGSRRRRRSLLSALYLLNQWMDFD